jgi:hypothetical protein
MLVGDTAQLPPVGSIDSPALDSKLMKDKFMLDVHSYELTDVLRQQQDSGILYNVTEVRDIIRREEEEYPQIVTEGYKDVIRMTGADLEEELSMLIINTGTMARSSFAAATKTPTNTTCRSATAF